MLAVAGCTHAATVEAPVASHVAATHGFAPHVVAAFGARTDARAFVHVPTLPLRTGMSGSREASCRAQLRKVTQSIGRYDASYDDLADMTELARLAIDAGGDCRLETDALFEHHTITRIGGCGASPIGVAIASWSLLAAVATTEPRRRAALRNLATVAYTYAYRGRDPNTWMMTADAYVRAAHAEPDAEDLWVFAVDAY